MRLILLFALAVSTAACGGETSEDQQTTETRLDDLDSLEGTISDDAINTDQLTDEGPIEGGLSPNETPKAKLDEEQSREAASPEVAKIEPEAAAE